MAVVEFEAAKKWAKLPKNVQVKLLKNVFCSSCGVTEIVSYSIKGTDGGIILDGQCKKCGRNVARFIEEG